MNVFLFFRYAVFALFVIFSTIIASIAAWNLGLLKDAGFYLQVDAFLIFLGVTGLLVIFPILFIEFVRKGAVVSRVWFEITWVALFWVLHLSGAAALVAMAPSFVCGPKAEIAYENICVSQNVLKTFTWLCSVMLVVYLLSLVVAAAVHMKHIPEIWKMGIPEVAWFHLNQRLASHPPTPILTRYRTGSTDSGPSEKSGVLPLYVAYSQQGRQSPPRLTVQTVPAPPRSEKLPAPPPVAHHPAHQPAARRQPTQYNATSLYPTHMHKTLVDAGFLPPSVSERKPVPPVQTSNVSGGSNKSSPSTSPATTTTTTMRTTTTTTSSSQQTSPSNGAAPPAVPRKIPPRERHRPPPLDLTLATRPLGTRVPARR